MNLTMEELKFLGFSSILSQSFKQIFTHKLIFSQITLTSILPLTITFISHMEISNRLFESLEGNPFQMFTDAFNSYQSYHTSDATITEWRNYIIFKFFTFLIITVFSVISTACIAFTIACIYTGRDVTFHKSVQVIPKVYKRVMFTFICMILILLTYSLITSVVIFINGIVWGDSDSVTRYFVFLAILILYMYGFLHLTVLLQVAMVVSVLENNSGPKSIFKSMELMNGKKKTALAVAFLLYQVLACVVIAYMWFVLYDDMMLMGVWRWMIGFVCCVVLAMVFLVVNVSQTVIYLVCKSHHREAVDAVGLSTFLSGYLRDSGPVIRIGDDIQLGRAQNQTVFRV